MSGEHEVCARSRIRWFILPSLLRGRAFLPIGRTEEGSGHEQQNGGRVEDVCSGLGINTVQRDSGAVGNVYYHVREIPARGLHRRLVDVFFCFEHIAGE